VNIQLTIPNPTQKFLMGGGRVGEEKQKKLKKKNPLINLYCKGIEKKKRVEHKGV